jgi:hypothetical protein
VVALAADVTGRVAQALFMRAVRRLLPRRQGLSRAV